jgi:hypothetical protein
MVKKCLQKQNVIKRMHGEPEWKFILRHGLALLGIVAAFYALAVVVFCW